MGNKKAQAAMEFLMTYGWAILIVLIALAALFFLGVFNPRTTNTCLVSAPFTCTDVKVSGTTLNLVLAASGSYSSLPSIVAAGANCATDPTAGACVNGGASTQCCTGAGCTPGAGPCTINTVTPTTLTFTIPSQTTGSKFSGFGVIGYTPYAGVSHSTRVQFSGVVE